jgi:hypothetical protein
MYVNTIYIQILIIYTICIYNYIYNAYTHIHICIYIYLHIRIHTYIHVYLYVDILSICIQIHTHTYIYIHMYTYIYIYMCRMIRSIHIYIFIIHKIIGQHLSNTYVTLIHYTILSRSISFHHLVWDGISATFRPWIFGCFPIDHHFLHMLMAKKDTFTPWFIRISPMKKYASWIILWGTTLPQITWFIVLDSWLNGHLDWVSYMIYMIFPSV